MNKVKSLGHDRRLIYKQPRQESGLCCFSFASYLQKSVTQIYRALYTPNANMANHSVVARDELHESEVSEALKMLPQKTLALSSICSVLFRCAYELLCF